MQKNKLTVLFAAAISLILYITASTSCISGPQGTYSSVDISGYVRTESDSIPLPGVLVLVDPPGSPNTYTDTNGFYEYHWTHSGGLGPPLEFLVTVVDVDGENNGVFISKDTLLYEENTEPPYAIWKIDFYVEILEDTTGTP